MKKTVVFITVDDNLVQKIFDCKPSYYDALQICKDNPELLHDEIEDDDYFLVEYACFNIEDAYGTDNFINDEALIDLYQPDEFDFSRMIYDIYGLEIEYIDYGEIEIWAEKLLNEENADMTSNEIIAKKLYDMSMDMDGDDYEETMDFDVQEIAKELNKLDKNGNLYKCIEQIVEMY